MLQDGFGRRFHYLRLSITDVCNFRCNYCLPDGYQAPAHPQPFLSRDEVAVLAAAFARLGTEKIRITGGEPSLRRDLPALINVCKQTPGIRKVALTTNGYRLEKDIHRWVDAGLDAINVSIDSLDPNTFAEVTGHNRLDSVLRGIDRAFEAGLSQVKVNAVMLKTFNGEGMTRFLDWLKTTPVTLRFIELMRTGDNATFFRENHVRGEDVMAALRQSSWQETLRTKDAGPAREFWHPDYAGRVGFILPYSKDFCASCNRLRVSSTGKLHLCLFADQGMDIRDVLQSGDVDAVMQRLTALVAGKSAHHALHQGYSGATRHLSMLGG